MYGVLTFFTLKEESTSVVGPGENTTYGSGIKSAVTTQSAATLLIRPYRVTLPNLFLISAKSLLKPLMIRNGRVGVGRTA